MRYCSNCGKEIPDNSKFCPYCSTPVASEETPKPIYSTTPPKPKKKKSGCIIPLIIICGIAFVIYLISSGISSCNTSRRNKPIKVKQISAAKCIECQTTFDPETTTVEKPRKEVGDKEYIYVYRDTVCEKCKLIIQEKSNKLFNEGISLYKSKKYNEAIKKFQNAAKLKHPDTKEWIDKTQSQINKQIKIETAKLESNARKQYKSLARNVFLEMNMDVKVTVYGQNNTSITLTYVLMSDVWVHNFQKSPMYKEIKLLGFKRLNFKDGYDYYTYPYCKFYLRQVF